MKSRPKSPIGTPHGRARARRSAMQALYQWQVSKQDLQDIEAQFRAEQDMRKMDRDYFNELLHGVPAQVDEIDNQLSPLLDRPLEQVGPVELAILRIGTFELMQRMDIPYRVAINEGVELAKLFGATESHKYVNGILDRLAQQLRAAEMPSRSRQPDREPPLTD